MRPNKTHLGSLIWAFGEQIGGEKRRGEEEEEEEKRRKVWNAMNFFGNYDLVWNLLSSVWNH